MKENDNNGRATGGGASTRRQFLAGAAPAIAAAAVTMRPGELLAQSAPSMPSVKIPKELADSSARTRSSAASRAAA